MPFSSLKPVLSTGKSIIIVKSSKHGVEKEKYYSNTFQTNGMCGQLAVLLYGPKRLGELFSLKAKKGILLSDLVNCTDQFCEVLWSTTHGCTFHLRNASRATVYIISVVPCIVILSWYVHYCKRVLTQLTWFPKHRSMKCCGIYFHFLIRLHFWGGY